MRATLVVLCVVSSLPFSFRAAGAQLAGRTRTPIDRATTIGADVRKGLVPDVRRLPQAQAVEVLARSGLRARLVDTTVSRLRDSVVDQSPEPGARLARNQVLTLAIGRDAGRRTAVVTGVKATVPNLTELTTVSTPTVRPVPVPRLIGLSARGVASSLVAARLGAGSMTREFSDEQEPGRVFHQDPAEGSQLMPGDPVNVIFSLGPHPPADSVRVPDLTGKTVITVPLRVRGTPAVVGQALAVAKRMIADSGFTVGDVSTVERSDVGAVITDQDPAAGVQAPVGSKMRLTENRPPSLRYVEVPQLLSLSRSEAAELIERQRLVVAEVVQRAADPRVEVVEQRPAAGTRVLERTGVVIWLDTLPGATPLVTPDPTATPQDADLLRVPSALGDELGPARERLRASGFDTVLVEGNTEPGAVVDSQFPDPGTLVPVGTSIALTLVGNRMRIVPSVLDTSLVAATAIATNADSMLFVIDEPPDSPFKTLVVVLALLTTIAGASLAVRSARTRLPAGVSLRVTLAEPQPPTVERAEDTLIRSTLEIAFVAEFDSPVLARDASSLIMRQRWSDD